MPAAGRGQPDVTKSRSARATEACLGAARAYQGRGAITRLNGEGQREPAAGHRRLILLPALLGAFVLLDFVDELLD